MKKLSIIIPQYNESEEDIRDLIRILDIQENVNFDDFEVVIVNDCSDCIISKKFAKEFRKLNLKLLRTPTNVGSGLCRQYGVDKTESEWIWFIDADDMVFSVLTIAKIFDTIRNNPDCQIIKGNFLEEIVIPNCDSRSYKINNGITWVHGKIYKREILEKFEMKFPEGIRVNEDSYFNGVLFNLGLRICDVDDVFCIWRANPTSLTRRDDKLLYLTGYPDFIKSKELLIEKLKQFVSRETYLYMVAQTMFFFYFNSQDKIWNKYHNYALLDKIDEMIVDFYNKYKKDFFSISCEELDEIYQKTRVEHFSQAKIRERETFEEYFDRINKKI